MQWNMAKMGTQWLKISGCNGEVAALKRCILYGVVLLAK